MANISQIQLVSAIMKELERQKIVGDVPIMNACVNAANSIIEEINRKRVYADHKMSFSEWLKSDDTGLSSKWLAHAIFGNPDNEVHYPYDPSDFGRCIRMLRSVRDAEELFAKSIKDIFPICGDVWKAYFQNFSKLVELWDLESPTGKCPQLYELMQKLRKEEP